MQFVDDPPIADPDSEGVFNALQLLDIKQLYRCEGLLQGIDGLNRSLPNMLRRLF
jgi:hypothetical protein